MKKVTVQTVQQHSNGFSEELSHTSGRETLSAQDFRRMLGIEQRRCERSGRHIALMLVEYSNQADRGSSARVAAKALQAITGSVRETDLAGWYEDTVVGVILTELGDAEGETVVTALSTRMMKVMVNTLGAEIAGKMRLSFHLLPRKMSPDNGCNEASGEVLPRKRSRDFGPLLKRAIDLGASFSMIVLGSPVLLLIAFAVKSTSRGPVLFRQIRIGRNGEPFTFLKFRSMQTGNDPKIHEEFVARLIRGDLDPGTKQFKIVADPRVTPIGRFLRRTSLDELPQLFNVLVGDMSLVGPRPPVLYEFIRYKSWHRRRLADIKPGITGLWQVEGRSRVGFDEMVRLDLRYARTWSLWLDFSILLATPRAVLSGNGAH